MVKTMLESRLRRSVLQTKNGVQQRDGWCRSSWMDLKNGWMSWIWTAVTVLIVDQRVGEISSCKQRRAEYRATGVPSARGGNDVGLSGSLPEPERSGSPANGMYQPYRVVSPSCFDVRPTVIAGREAGGQLEPVGRRLL
jgi:hypothetical protein